MWKLQRTIRSKSQTGIMGSDVTSDATLSMMSFFFPGDFPMAKGSRINKHREVNIEIRFSESSLEDFAHSLSLL